MQASKLAGRIEELSEQSRALADKPEQRDFVVLLLLLLVQACCFLPICFHVGFYLDDWLTFWNLHFAPHNFVDLLKASLSDPRIVTRPVQCVYYALSYWLFADKPVGYHLLRFALEYLGAACLYLGMKRLSLSRFVAALTALVFILYPTHDATHYWLGGGLGPGFGLTLYLASFYFSEENPSVKGMGTTVVVGVQDNKGYIHIGHLGDSRAYLVRNGIYEVLTQDHSLVMELYRGGHITEEQMKESPFKHYITRCVGHKDRVELEQNPRQLLPGDWLLMCTDGLTAVLQDEQIAQVVSQAQSPEEACQNLVQMTLDGGAPDNVTVVVIKYHEENAD